MSSQRSPRSSPERILVVMATTYRASSLSPRTALRSVLTSSSLRGLISCFCSLGGSTASVMFLGISDHLTACLRALWRIVWIILTVLAERPESSLELYEGLQLECTQPVQSSFAQG